MVKVIVNGAKGRMGSEAVKAVNNDSELELVGSCDFGDDLDIVFDLAGAISSDARSITTAIKQSDVVVVPINNEFKAIKAGLHSISEQSVSCTSSASALPRGGSVELHEFPATKGSWLGDQATPPSSQATSDPLPLPRLYCNHHGRFLSNKLK